MPDNFMVFVEEWKICLISFCAGNISMATVIVIVHFL